MSPLTRDYTRFPSEAAPRHNPPYMCLLADRLPSHKRNVSYMGWGGVGGGPITFRYTSSVALATLQTSSAALAHTHTRHSTLETSSIALAHIGHDYIRDIFCCSCAYTSCYATDVSAAALAQTRHTTLEMCLLLHLHIYVMLS